MVAENTSGSQTAVIDTEHTLATVTAAGVYVLRVDTSNMVLGDRVVLRAKTESRVSESVALLLYEGPASDVQIEVLKDSPPVAVPASGQVVFTLEQTDGTGRVFEWSIIDLAS